MRNLEFVIHNSSFSILNCRGLIIPIAPMWVCVPASLNPLCRSSPLITGVTWTDAHASSLEPKLKRPRHDLFIAKTMMADRRPFSSGKKQAASGLSASIVDWRDYEGVVLNNTDRWM